MPYGGWRKLNNDVIHAAPRLYTCFIALGQTVVIRRLVLRRNYIIEYGCRVDAHEADINLRCGRRTLYNTRMSVNKPVSMTYA
jgi:hypothetical protein